MTRMVAIANQKGGVGKTTTAINLAAALALSGKRVLLVDSDPQGNAGSGLGFPGLKVPKGIYEVLISGTPITEVIVETEVPGLHLVPSGQRLAGAEIELADAERREFKLKEALEPLQERYDFILIDVLAEFGFHLTLLIFVMTLYLIILAGFVSSNEKQNAGSASPENKNRYL